MTDITVSEAKPSDLESLGTIVERSFNPVNSYIKQCFPSTPTVRNWWSQIFSDLLKDPASHPLVAYANTTDKDIGILTLRLLEPEEKGAGFWTVCNWTSDHDVEMIKPMVDTMVEYRERLMLGRKHFLIELFGAAYAYKGRGVGTKLLAKACEIADGAGLDVFVQSNASARDFYARQGFRVEGEAVMPGGAGYKEYLMVRRYNAKKG